MLERRTEDWCSLELHSTPPAPRSRTIFGGGSSFGGGEGDGGGGDGERCSCPRCIPTVNLIGITEGSKDSRQSRLTLQK